MWCPASQKACNSPSPLNSLFGTLCFLVMMSDSSIWIIVIYFWDHTRNMNFHHMWWSFTEFCLYCTVLVHLCVVITFFLHQNSLWDVLADMMHLGILNTNLNSDFSSVVSIFDNDQNPQPRAPLWCYPQSIILKVVIHCVGCLPVIYDRPLTGSATQTPWTRMSFVLCILPEASSTFVASFLLTKSVVGLLLKVIHFPTFKSSTHCSVPWNLSCPLVWQELNNNFTVCGGHACLHMCEQVLAYLLHLLLYLLLSRNFLKQRCTVLK